MTEPARQATTNARIPLWSMPVAGATTYVNMEPYDWRARSPGFQCCCKWKRKSIRARYNVIASSSTVMMAGWPALSRSGTRSIGRVHGSNIVPM